MLKKFVISCKLLQNANYPQKLDSEEKELEQKEAQRWMEGEGGGLSNLYQEVIM